MCINEVAINSQSEVYVHDEPPSSMIITDQCQPLIEVKDHREEADLSPLENMSNILSTREGSSDLSLGERSVKKPEIISPNSTDWNIQTEILA